MVLTLISSVLGFARESYIAYAFGASRYTDAYYVAFVVPDIIAGWIGFALTNALIPVLKKEYQFSQRSGISLINHAFYFVFSVSILLTLFAYLFRNEIIELLAPAFTGEQREIGVQMLTIMLFAIVFSAFSGLFGGINNSFESYLFPALVGIFFNSFFFLGLVGFEPFFGVNALAYGFLIGVVGRFTIQVIPLVKRKQLTLRVTEMWHPKLTESVIGMLPIFLSQAVMQTNQIVDRILASGLPEGQVSNLNYASKLGLLPIGLIGSSIAVTTYTRFVNYHINSESTQAEALLNRAITWIMLAAFVIGGGFLFFGESLVSFFYYQGAFKLQDVETTTILLKVYGGFALFYMLLPIISQYYFAQKGGKHLLLSSSISVIINISLGFLMAPIYGAVGLVVASGIASFINVAILYVIAIKKLRKHLFRNLGHIVMDVLPTGLLIWVGLFLVPELWPTPGLKEKLLLLFRGVTALIVSGIAVIAYVFTFLKVEVSEVILALVLRFIRKPNRTPIKEKL